MKKLIYYNDSLLIELIAASPPFLAGFFMRLTSRFVIALEVIKICSITPILPLHNLYFLHQTPHPFSPFCAPSSSSYSFFSLFSPLHHRPGLRSRLVNQKTLSHNLFLQYSHHFLYQKAFLPLPSAILDHQIPDHCFPIKNYRIPQSTRYLDVTKLVLIDELNFIVAHW